MIAAKRLAADKPSVVMTLGEIREQESKGDDFMTRFTETDNELLERERFFKGHGRSTIIPDDSPAAPKDVDKLTQMFAMQSALVGRIIDERGIEKTSDEWVTGLTIATESEIDEIRREVNWKWWKNPKPIDEAALQGEVIDMWHFLLSLSRVVGLTPYDIHRLYLEKNAENHDRQAGLSDKGGYEVSAE